MKKLQCRALAALLSAGLLAVPVQAQNSNVLGTVCWSDILAQIDGRPIASYNWNGSTVVPAEHLNWYGLAVRFDGKSLWIEQDPEGERSGTYTPLEDRPAAGTTAYEIYRTDIATYVQGERVEGLNIGGTTMVRLTDLSACGQVSWDPVNSVAELKLFQDPAARQEELLAQSLDEQAAALGGSSSYETYRTDSGYPRQDKTLFVGKIELPDGETQSTMVCIYHNGRILDVKMLLPEEIVENLAPRDINLETGTLRFFTPRDTADVYCSIRLGSSARPGPEEAALEWVQAMDKPLTTWEAEWSASDWTRDGSNAEVVFQREQDRVKAECLEAPFDDGYAAGCSFRLDQTGWSSSLHGLRASGLTESDSGWSRAWYTLWEMAPGPWQEGYAEENSPQLREQVSRYLKVTLNGEPVSGVLLAMRGNNHIDLSFTFDRPVSLAEGDQLRVWVGMPE